MSKVTYVEHLTIDVEGFRVADATATGNRPHDDLVWVGYGGMEGQWLATEKALAVAKAIETVVASHTARHGKQ